MEFGSLAVGNSALYFYLIGGLGIFLFGISFMGEGLKLLAGDKIKVLIDKYTSNPIKGVLVGIVVTVLMQSSSATTSLTVSLINAGLMTLPQSIGVILGASIGATVTSVLIGLNISNYALPLMGIGSFLLMFGKKDKQRYLGQSIFGFGSLFFGLTIMGIPLKEMALEPWFQNTVVALSNKPVVSVAIGTILTFLIQSSGAFIGIVQTLYQSGSVPFLAAITLTIGSNLGTTITAVLASLGGSTAAKQSAAFHVMFKFVGVIGFLLLMNPFIKMIIYLSSLFNLRPAMQIALAHGVYNILLAAMVLPFAGKLMELVKGVIKKKKEPDYMSQLLNRKLIKQSTSMAIEQSTNATQKMAKVVLKMLKATYEYSLTGKQELIDKVRESDKLVDLMETEIQEYVVDLMHQEVSDYENKRAKYILHVTKELETMADLTVRVQKAFVSFKRHNTYFDDDSFLDYRRMMMVTIDITRDCISLIGHRDDELASRVLLKENTVDLLEAKSRRGHSRRIRDYVENRHDENKFVDMISMIESISDSASGIAKYIQGFSSKFKEEIDYEFLDALLKEA